MNDPRDGAARAAALAGGLALCAPAAARPRLGVGERLRRRPLAAAAAEPRGRLAPARHAGRLARRPRSASSAARARTVADVRVVGSRSGAHAGVLRAYSTGTGESFLPAHPFARGRARDRHAHGCQRAGASAAPRARASRSPTRRPSARRSSRSTPATPSAVQHYISAPTLTPSTVTSRPPPAAARAPGYLFLAPYQGEGSPGPMIAEQNGSLVWFHPLPAGEDRHQLPRPAVRGQARAHLVAGARSSRSASARAKTRSTTAPTSTWPRSGRATATTPTCTKSG